MSSFCQDRDILAVEPIAYLGGGFDVAQQLITGIDGVVSSTTFTSAGSDFVSAGIAAGMVLCAYTSIPSEGAMWEIISVDSATTLTVSVLRSDLQDSPVAPPTASGLSFHIRTFGARIADVSAMLGEKLRTLCETNPIATADFADSSQLRITTACGVLAGVFLARADSARPHDANWIKAEFYRGEFLRLQGSLLLTVDANGDGTAERTRTLGNATLKRV